VLGETDRHHFYSSQELPVKNEVLYHTMDEEKWFTSKNSKASMQIILAGRDVSPIESVALANFATLDTKKWEADMTTFRSFDTVLSYNNSAVGVYWPKMTLEPDQQGSVTFYLSFAADGAVPGGAAYVFADEKEADEQAEAEALAENGQAEQAGETKVQNIQAVKETPAATPAKEPVEEKPAAKQPAEPDAQKPQSVSAIPEISMDKLSVDYIQRLLDRIDQLEEGDPEINKAEINMLNAELDAILSILNEQ